MSKQITFRSEKGQTMAEYAVVLGVITLAIVASFSLLSEAAGAAIGAIAELVNGVA